MIHEEPVYHSLGLARRGVLKSICLCTLGMAISDVFWLRCASAAVTLPKDFAGEIERAGLVFNTNVFREFEVARLLSNRHFEYSLALRHQRLPFEARYATRYLPPAKGIRQDALLEAYVSSSIMNMARKGSSGPVMEGPRAFDSNAVRNEFGADWGVTSMIATEPTFSKYDSGLVNVIYLQKKEALGYSIYLFNGKPSDEIMQVIDKIFHAMQFRR
jgi:hypothetical protein